MKYCAWLHSTGVMGAAAFERMAGAGLCAEDIWKYDERKLRASGVFLKSSLERVIAAKKEKSPDELKDELIREGIKFCCLEKGDYPQKLINIHNAPYGLFYKGRLPDPERPCVGIVGARNCSNYGGVIAYETGMELAKRGIGVISGLARGIDSRGQSGALDGGGLTYGVLGCGIDICYPPENISLYNRICENGGMISEFAPNEAPIGRNFPIRNRIISGLSDVLIVVEAKRKSGSLITADMALDQGKDVYAVPGNLDSANSVGTNYLIKQGAGIFLSVEDMLEDMGAAGVFAAVGDSAGNKDAKRLSEADRKIVLADFERVVYSSLTLCPKGLDMLLEDTGLTIKELYQSLFNLIKAGYVKEISKNNYARAGI